MATQKYTVKKETLEKITKLFAYRRLTDLLKASGLANNKEFVANIINVQYQIYLLDGYLESQWDLDKAELKKLWEAIYLSLSSMGYDKEQVESLTKEISKYERIERNSRKDKWPTKESMKDFYLTKSCDVRLIRRLIYNTNPSLNEQWKKKSWMYYDIITEINDDITDLAEDVSTYNGNRLLISVLRKGQDKTVKEYKTYLEKITSKAADYFSAKEAVGKNKLLAKWTADRSKQTLKLLDGLTKSKVIDKLSASLLLGHMK